MTKTMKQFLDEHPYELIIDVREEDEFTEGHVQGAINIPLGTLENYQENKEKDIAVYCHSGRRSEMAKNILLKNGYCRVENIGGVIDGSMELVQ